MIDTVRTRSVHFRHFVFREAFGSPGIGALLAVAAAVPCLAGCSPHSKPGTVEDTVTSGRIRIECASEADGLVARERSAFQTLYPQARIELTSGTSREAIRALFAAECDMAVISRELRPEERRSATLGKLDLEGYRFARNAVMLVVHPSNVVQNLGLDEVRSIYAGGVSRWSELGGGPLPIVPVAQPAGADVTEFFTEEALGAEPMLAHARTAANDSMVIAAVEREPGAIGYVSLGTPTGRARVLAIGTLRGLPYWKPDLEAIYKGDYPLTRFYNMYVRASGPSLANGFITFVTSMDGQRLVKDAGLLPTNVPVRFVRRSPMLSTHARGDSVSTP